MKKIKQKLAVWLSLFMLISQYRLVLPVVNAETTDSPVEQLETVEVQGVPGPLKFALKFLGKQSLKLILLDIEENTDSPAVSSMATSALRLLVPNKMIFRELDQIQDQLSDQLTTLTETVDNHFAKYAIKEKIKEINEKRRVFQKISGNYGTLSSHYTAAINAYETYAQNPSGENYQSFYSEYIKLSFLLGKGDELQSLEANFNTDLATLLSLLAPLESNGGGLNSNNYLYDISSYAADSLAFRHQAYDLMAASYEEIVGYSLDYLMAYRTYTTVHVEETKNKLYAAATQSEQRTLVEKIKAYKDNYQSAANQLLTAIEQCAEHYLVPIMGDRLSEAERQVKVQMNYVKEQKRKTDVDGVNPYVTFTAKAIDTAPTQTFYRVRPISPTSEGQATAEEVANYYILNHGTGTANEKKENIHHHRIYNLWGKDVYQMIFKNDFYYPGTDFFNLRETKDNGINAKLLESPQAYRDLFKAPSYVFSKGDFFNHLTAVGKLPGESITGSQGLWLMNYYLEPKHMDGNHIIDGYLGLLDSNTVKDDYLYQAKDFRVQLDNLSKESYAKEDSDEPYLVILQGQEKEAYSLTAAKASENVLSFDVAQENYDSQGRVIAGSQVGISVNLPEAKSGAGYKNEVTRLVVAANGVEEEIYTNQIDAESEAEPFVESFEVPTEFVASMPYGKAEVFVEYEEVKENYGITFESSIEQGYATFTATSYLQDRAEFGEKVEITVSPLKGHVATGIEVRTETGELVASNPVPASESGIPNIGGGVFAFAMPAGQVTVKPIYEAGVVVNLKTVTDDKVELEKEVMTFTDQYLWDINLLDDNFENGVKKEDIVTEGTFKKEAELVFKVANTVTTVGDYVLKSIIGDLPQDSDDLVIPLNDTGKYQHTIPSDIGANYNITANYMKYTAENAVVLKPQSGGQMNFLGLPAEMGELPHAVGEKVTVEIVPDQKWEFDKAQLKFMQAADKEVFPEYETVRSVDHEGNPRYQLTFAKMPGKMEIYGGFTQENLVLLEGNYGSLRFKESNANREQYANGETIQIKLDPLAKFDKDSLQILADGKVVVASDNVKYREDILSFKKPKTSAMITVKGDFEPYYAITKVIEEIGEGKNTFKTLDANGKERENWYEGEEVKLDFTDEEKAKLAQIRIIGETSGTVRVVNFTRESLNFTMPNEAVRIEVSFDNESGQTIVLPSQNDEGEYLLSSYNQLVTVSKLMSLSLKDNSYLEAKYVLDGFIDCQNKPLDTWGSSEKPFMGSLDGKGFSIVKLKVGRAGLIDTIGKTGVVKNFGILSVVLPQENQAGGYSGVVAGQNYGTIDNMYLGLAKETTHVIGGSARVYKRADLNQTLTANATDFGSVTGRNYGQLTNITNYFTLKSRNATEGIGGLVGRLAENSSLINSNNLGTMDVTKSAPGTANGGLVAVGAQGNLVMQNNYSHFTLVGSSDKLSPLMGNNLSIKADNYYSDLAGDFPEGLGGTKLTSADMKSDTFAETLNGGVENNSNLKMWDRKEERDEQLPYLKGGHLKINQLTKQSMNSGIFTVTSHVPYDTTLQVTNLMKTKDAAVLMAAVQEGEIEELVDLSLQHPETQVKPHEDTEIKIDISQFVKTAENRSFKLLHQRGEKVEVVELTREGNYLVGKVNSLSPFALVSATTDEDIVVDETPTVPSDEGNRSSSKGILPKTGEKVTMSLAVVGMILCAGVVVYYFKRRNEKE